MTPLAWLLGLFLPACGAVGAHGLPPPRPIDFARLERPATPNTALAAPAGFRPPPDLITPAYALAAPALFALVRQVAASEPRTYPAASFAPPLQEDATLQEDSMLQEDWVVRSAWWNFPDLVTAQVTPDGAGHAALILYSRSVYGRSDFGVNRARLRVWLARLAAALPPQAPGPTRK